MRVAIFILLTFAMAANASAQNVTYQRLLNADKKEPQNWLTFSGAAVWAGDIARSIRSTPANAQEPGIEMGIPDWIDAADGSYSSGGGWNHMYASQPPNWRYGGFALDAKTGRVFWIYNYRLPLTAGGPCCRPRIIEGLRFLGNTRLYGHDRWAFGGDRCQEWASTLGRSSGGLRVPGLLRLTGDTPRREGQDRDRSRRAAKKGFEDS